MNKKSIIFIFCILGCILILGGCRNKNINCNQNYNIEEKNNPFKIGEIRYVAHRGNPDKQKNMPENNLETIKNAAERGYTYVEIDIRQTKDDYFVCVHDSKLNYISTCNDNVENLTLNELKKITLKNRDTFELQIGYTISELEEVLKYCNDNKIYLFLEIKTDYPINLIKFSKLIEKYKNSISICSFSIGILNNIYELIHDVSLFYLIQNYNETQVEKMEKARRICSGILVDFRYVNKDSILELIEQNHRYNLCVGLWTVYYSYYTARIIEDYANIGLDFCIVEGIWDFEK